MKFFVNSIKLIIIILLFSCSQNKQPHELIEETIRKGDINTLESIVKKYSIDLNDTKFKYKPLSIAVMRNNFSMCEKLLELGADINSIGVKGHTPLHLASGWGRKEMVEYLIKKGAKINPRDYISWTPLMWASIRGKYENVELLLRYGDNPNSTDLDKNTPLMLAAYRNQKFVISLLLQYKADRNMKNIYGQTFCDILKLRGFSETAIYFSCS
ncbi:MAG: ankyrin repeat domain-containing protein [Elusimicrobiales bacterium]|nr:ankyrin repeat domain-containing protein [Elusimicrobiales bacterium]